MSDDVRQLLSNLLASGVYLSIDGPTLRCKGQVNFLTEDVLERIKKNKKEIIQFLSEEEATKGYELSFGQRGLWSLYKLNSESAAYNIACAVNIKSSLDQTILSQSIRLLTERHPVLRMIYGVKDGELRQFLSVPEAIKVNLHKVEEWDEQNIVAWINQRADKPFDLERGPVVRIDLLQCKKAENFSNILLLVIHHIACDFWSLELFLSELEITYHALSSGASPALPIVQASYHKDYVIRQKMFVSSEKCKQDCELWKQHISRFPFVLNLPFDRPRKTLQSFKGDVYNFTLESDLISKVKELSKKMGTTPFTIMMALFQIAIASTSHQKKFLIGTPVSGRKNHDLKNTFGFLANPIVLGVDLTGSITFEELVRRVGKELVGALKFQDIPFLYLVESMKLKKSLECSPLFQVMCVWHQAQRYNSSSDFLTGLFPVAHVRGAPEDLVLTIRDAGETYQLTFIYNTDLFNRDTIENISRHFQDIAHLYIKNPGLIIACNFPEPDVSHVASENDQVKKIASLLLGHASVQEVVVTRRASSVDNDEHFIAYIVENVGFSMSNLQRYINQEPTLGKLKIILTPIYSMPLKEDGSINTDALRKLPIIDQFAKNKVEKIITNYSAGTAFNVDITKKIKKTDTIPMSAIFSSFDQKIVMNNRVIERIATRDVSERVSKSAHQLAIADGGPIFIGEGCPNNMVSAFIQTAKDFGLKGIFHVIKNGSDDFQSYESLYKRAKCILAGLRKIGCQKGASVILQFNDLQHYFPTLWACLLGGIIPVTVAVPPSYGLANGVLSKLFNVWTLLNFPTVLAADSLREALPEINNHYKGVNFKFFFLNDIEDELPSDDIYIPSPSDVAFYQLSSGSTGTPKCIQITHQGIVQHINAAVQVNAYTSEDVSLNWLTMDHVVPLLMFHFKDVYLGCMQVQVPTSLILARPLLWLDLIEKYKVTETWSPNFGYNLLVDCLEKNKTKTWDLSSIKHFINAGEQVTASVVREFLSKVKIFGVLPNKMQPAYGMAEMCTAFVYGNNFSLESHVHRLEKKSLAGKLKRIENNSESVSFVDHGSPVPGIKIRIVDKNNQLYENDMIGRIQVKGAVRTPGYLNNSAANKESLLEDGWYNTGDLGFLHDGNLTITGREKELIIINGANFFCYEIEDFIASLDGVAPSYVAACGVANDKIGTESLIVFFSFLTDESQTDLKVIKNIRTKVAINFGVEPTYIIPIHKKDFPKTTSGKIQRTKLKEQFLNDEYREVLKSIDEKLNDTLTIPNWFYTKIWSKKKINHREKINFSGQTFLVFSEKSGFSVSLIQYLQKNGGSVVTVNPGVGFKRESEVSYAINPENNKDYLELFYSLNENHSTFSHIIHLWSYGRISSERVNAKNIESAQHYTSLSLLFLTQALAQFSNSYHSLKIYVASTQSQMVHDYDLLHIEKCTLQGFIKTMAFEFPHFLCRHIDLQEGRDSENLHHLVDELLCIDKDLEVCIRSGERWFPRLKQVDTKNSLKGDIPFQKHGTYIICGGLGGIGFELAEFLLKQYDAKLLLIGRKNIGNDVAVSEENKECLDRFSRLISISSYVDYACADICDLEAMRHLIVEQAQKWNGQVDGIIHLAGVFSPLSIIAETEGHFLSSLAPKLVGSWVLSEVIKQYPNAIYIHFSSVNGFFGGVGAGAYAAANSYVDNLSLYLAKHFKVKTYHMAWSLWDNVGMSRGYDLRDIGRLRGFEPIAIRQGIYSFLVAMRHPNINLLIGLDKNNYNIKKYLKTEDINNQHLTIFAETESATLEAALAENPLCDRFGTLLEYKFEKLNKGSESSVSNTSETVKVNNLESKLLQIWKDVLPESHIGPEDNFFEAGGNSLAVVKIVSKVEQLIGKEVKLVTLFTYPTVRELARHLGDTDKSAVLSGTPQVHLRQDRKKIIFQQRNKRALSSTRPSELEEN